MSSPPGMSSASSSSASSSSGPITPTGEHEDPFTFHTLTNVDQFKNPPKSTFVNPSLQDLIAPHLESFNALFSDDPSINSSPEAAASTSRGSGGGLLDRAIRSITPKVAFDRIQTPTTQPGERGNRVEMAIEGIHLGKPSQTGAGNTGDVKRVWPIECRERLMTYKARMTARVSYSVNGLPKQVVERDMGMVPIMIKSNRCHLRDLSSEELVAHNEEAAEMGGYFLINGNERLIRLLIVPRSNHVVAIDRPSFSNRGPSYTSKGCQIRCLHRNDLTSVTNTIHYLDNGGVTLRFSWKKREYMIPAIMLLKALVSASDKDIFMELTRGEVDNTFLTDRVEMLLRGFKSYSLFSGDHCLEYLGSKFRIVLGCPEDWSDIDVGVYLIDKVVLVHLDSPRDKYRLLVFMMRKLYALVGGECSVDNPDSPQHQEVLLPGFLYGMIIKERLDEYLSNLTLQITRDVRQGAKNLDFFDGHYMTKVFRRVTPNIGGRLSSFLATGNLLSPSGLDLQQVSGFTVVAEKLNFYRYVSHFRSVHRGAFFAELKTTSVRKLLPEAWGFLCPVHTPDGSPCGLLNHFSHTCQLVTRELDVSTVLPLLSSMGMSPAFAHTDGRTHVVVQLDGSIVGWATPALAQQMANNLRLFKTQQSHGVPLDLEIGYVPVSKAGQYPGLYLFSGRARMMRPVKYLSNGHLDHVGPFEQVYLDVACLPEDVHRGLTTHIEWAPTNVLSVIANLTPFSDFNQSPRNMYQCQMGKQTMGTPSTSISRRTDNKLYRIQTPQTPIVRPKLHDKYGFDGFPNGTNAIVAVISYTGYDMEDAMILNKSAHERGFGYGTVYKSEVLDLTVEAGSRGSSTCNLRFGFGPDVGPNNPIRERLDEDGLLPPGEKVKMGEPMVAYWDTVTNKTKYKKFKGDDFAYVDTVRLMPSSETSGGQWTKLQITLRIPRSPVIGDKFSSRHGQKGVCSQKWPAIDMPFSESGMQPDVIINPHAFPSRMTIGMLVESMAGKAGALHGLREDGTPWTFNEGDTPHDYFGEQLVRAGYSRLGHEPMYSGITGQELQMDIYLGCVYYQRLRHMVNDKFQCRTTGPVHALTRQPIKGRKVGGGIRFGEMERDATLAHGCAFLLADRLMNCSDYSTCYVCRDCGSITSLGYEARNASRNEGGGGGADDAHMLDAWNLEEEEDRMEREGLSGEYCRVCRANEEERRIKALDAEANGGEVDEDEAKDSMVAARLQVPAEAVVKRGSSGLDTIAISYVTRYLAAELASMGVKLSFHVR
ncbi:putative RPA135-DNA-directed RNA polymerase I, 135 kd subunit [Jaminaea rosea]|uniref:DNA-directed RNA polymerase subunit beta n=1 Tax=Jaminaea rosea TaxID=1569628 RepID=A0A316V359_9BASI|nr:putative RPA135-DNA-directed RNA polymerase I, 135 kd subunit [Jaminaea rosea]PWN30971.1 putative RPA135-DNA-directed RNA polymerase I, 135 kd subunit [Jaminaea rosea]